MGGRAPPARTAGKNAEAQEIAAKGLAQQYNECKTANAAAEIRLKRTRACTTYTVEPKRFVMYHESLHKEGIAVFQKEDDSESLEGALAFMLLHNAHVYSLAPLDLRNVTPGSQHQPPCTSSHRCRQQPLRVDRACCGSDGERTKPTWPPRTSGCFSYSTRYPERGKYTFLKPQTLSRVSGGFSYSTR